MALNSPSQVVADWIELRNNILPAIEAAGLPSGALDTAVALSIIQSSGGGSGASAGDIGNAVNGTPITGQSLESGGAGTTGWLASLRKAVTDRLPSSLGAKTGATSFSVVPASDGFPITNTGIGLPADSAATSDTGTFSIVSLLKRWLARVGSTKLFVSANPAASGDNTIIAAPSAGVRIVISGLRIQANTDIASTVLIKNGAGITLAQCDTTVRGSGIDVLHPFGSELRLSAATAFILNLSAANQHGVSVIYWLETVTTGLP